MAPFSVSATAIHPEQDERRGGREEQKEEEEIRRNKNKDEEREGNIKIYCSDRELLIRIFALQRPTPA